jgi:lipopolysaccharide/colanic/teichoic acid biosynthesis glycosyltransferase
VSETTVSRARPSEDASLIASLPESVAVPTSLSLRTYLFVKRLLDIIVSLAGIVLCLPLWALVAVAIKLDSRGPIIFRQLRPGYLGRPFWILKFRTMLPDAEERLDEVMHLNVQKDGSLIRIRNDPRVTRVGRWLRKTSLDETLQLINVLRGEMSLVGPRPISRPIPDPRGLWRLQARPGITGLWQINGRKETDTAYMLAKDMEYLQRRCLLLDLYILLMTIPAAIRGNGAE